MRAIILAAGMGRRLNNCTNGLPKCLININNKTILQHQIESLIKNNITDISVVIGYKKELIEDCLSKIKNDNITISTFENKDFDKTNTSFSLWQAKEKMEGGFVYLNGDFVFHPDLLKKLLKSTNARVVDENKQFKNNIQILSDQSAKLLINNMESMISTGDKSKKVYELFCEVDKQVPFEVVSIEGIPWYEIDTKEDLESAVELFNQTEK